MKKPILILFIVLLSGYCLSQPVTRQWVRTYNGPSNGYDFSGKAVTDNAGNIYVCGQSDGTGTQTDIVVIKYNSTGTQLWQVRYNGPANSIENPWGGLAVDNSGNVYVAGASYGSSNNDDYILVKYNSAGVFQWAARYNGPINYHDEINAMTIDNNGFIYVTGQSSSSTSNDYCTIKYNSNGDSVWVRRWDGGDNAIPQDYARGIDVDASGNVYVTGHGTLYPNNGAIATIKYNSAGVQQWVKIYDIPGGSEDAFNIKSDNTGSCYISGKVYNGSNDDFFTMKLNPSGDTVWTRLYNGTGNAEDRAYSMVLDASGNVYITGKSHGGSSQTDFTTVKYSPSGTQQWVQRYNGTANLSDEAYAIAIDNASNIYVAGSSNETGTGYDMTIIKYSSGGSQLWIQKFDTLNGQGGAGSIAIDNANIYMFGSQPILNVFNDLILVKYAQPITADTCFVKTFSCSASSSFLMGETKTDAAGNVYTIGTCNGGGDYDIITSKYNNNGTLQWSQVFDSSAIFDYGNSLDIDASGNVYICGVTGQTFVTIKYNSSGVRQWLKIPALSGSSAANKVRLDASGNVFVSGISNSSANADIVTVKYDANGNQQWLQTWNGPANDADLTRDMAIDPSGNVIVLGDTKDPGPLFINNFVTIKYNSGGTFQWAQTYNRYGESAISISVDKFDNIFVSGMSSPNSGALTDIATIKYNPAGVQQWAQIYNGPANDFDHVYNIAADTLGNVYVAGDRQNPPGATEAITIKYNSSGTQQWVKAFSYSNSNTLNISLSLDRTGNVYTVAQAVYNSNYYLIANKYDPTGIQLWQKTNSGGNSQNLLFYRKNMSVDYSGNVFVACGNKVSPTVDNQMVIKYCQDIPLGINTSYNNEIPNDYRLYQNYPNPFNPVTKIKFHVPDHANVSIKIYDLIGREVTTLINDQLKPGTYEAEWNALNYPSGVYFYQLLTAGYSETRKMVLIR